jgi:hypothetical protein
MQQKRSFYFKVIAFLLVVVLAVPMTFVGEVVAVTDNDEQIIDFYNETIPNENELDTAALAAAVIAVQELIDILAVELELDDAIIAVLTNTVAAAQSVLDDPVNQDAIDDALLALNEVINALNFAQSGIAPLDFGVPGTLGNVYLITGDVLEIEFNAPSPILNNVDAQRTFTILIDNTVVAWEFLSYFEFGSYGERGGVVNVRLAEELDVGAVRGRRRELASPEAWLTRTEHINGPIAASRIRVVAGLSVAQSQWNSFYTERNFGHMSRVLSYISGEGGNNGRVGGEWGATNFTLPPNSNAMNIFGPNMEPRYNEEFVVRQVGEGLHRFFGRGEFLALPMVRSGFNTLIVGPAQSVYEAPQFRDLYEHGVTTDTFTRRSIKATSVPNNFDPIYGTFERPFIVVTSDDIMRHDSPMNELGEVLFTIDANGQRVNTDHTALTGTNQSARPRSDFFYLGEAFFDYFWEVGGQQGTRQFPLGPNNYWDDFRFDIHIERAFDNAIAQGLWPNTILTATHCIDTGRVLSRTERIKNFYVYGAMVFWEFMPESRYFQQTSMPINTRGEMYYYDYDLYWALSGLHGREEFWTGVGNLSTVSSVDDTSKWRVPWFRDQQPDNYGFPACFDNFFNVPGGWQAPAGVRGAGNARGGSGAPCPACVARTCAEGIRGVPHAPLHITDVVVSSHNQIMVYFNRVVRTRGAVTSPLNFEVWIGDTMVPAGSLSQTGGYHWNSIRLQVNTGGMNFATGVVPNPQFRLDNGNPYGRHFGGFTQSDLNERSIANGGWIANNQAVGRFPLEFGEFVDLERAINEFGAGMRAEGVSIVYTGNAWPAAGTRANWEPAPDPNVNRLPVLDWAGNELSMELSLAYLLADDFVRATNTGTRLPARFEPWQAVAYRSPLVGLYTHMDTVVGTHPRHPYSQLEVVISGTRQMEILFQRNDTATYDHLAGAMYAWNGLLNPDGSRQMVRGFREAYPGGLPFATLLGGTGQGANSQTPMDAQWFYNTSVTYDRPGQRIADGSTRAAGGMQIAAGSVRGRHPGRLPSMNQMHGTNVGDLYRIGGWGSNNFQAEDSHIMRDFNLCRYRIENLVIHEGGHGIDSFQRGLGFGHEMYSDMTSAWRAAVNVANGRRWNTVDNVPTYFGNNRGEYVATAGNYWAGTMRESFSGTNDGVWSPVSTRQDFFRYDPFGFEAWRRLSWDGELGLWFNDANGNPQIGNPEYRVMLEDWELLRDQFPQEFGHWTSDNYLMAWGASIIETAHHNPYTEARNSAAYMSQVNNAVRWVSWNIPHIWNIYPHLPPSNPNFPNNRFDFAGADFQSGLDAVGVQLGGTPHHPMAPFGTTPVAEMVPHQNQTHPFHRVGGVPMPERTPEIAALAAPVSATVVEGSARIPYRLLLVEFQIENFGDNVITNNNVQTSFDLRVNGQYTHFYFWAFEQDGATGTVTVRLDWPLERTDVIQVTPRVPFAQPELSFDIFNNGEGGSPSRPNASLYQAGFIRMWTQLDGVGASLPYPNLSITAEFPDGTSAMQFVRVNRAWVEGQGWQDHFSSIDVLKGNGDWEIINFSITAFNQTVDLVLVNNRFVAPAALSFDIFNNGEGGSPSRPNASLHQAGFVRMWVQLDGVGASLPYPNLSITATLPDGTSAMQFVRVNRAWVEGQGWQDHFSSIDILKGNGDWEVINFSITVLNQTVNLVLVNNRFVPPTT